MTELPPIHNWDPVIFQLTDAIAVRWYGVAYMLGFVIGFFLLCRLARKNLYPIPEEKLSDFITWVALIGVLLGGRLGYVLFYMLPNEGIGYILNDPTVIVRVWEGGMASHGGMLGVVAYAIYYARKHKLPWPAVLDGLAIVAPVGLFFGRLANFINGELYGNIVPVGSKCGMIFPTELLQSEFLFNRVAHSILSDSALQESITNAGYQIPAILSPEWIITCARHVPELENLIAKIMIGHSRYPSQLYEAATEGLLLFAILWCVRIFWKRAYNGIFCGIFCIVYSIARIACEEFREPDSPFTFGLTRGQFLSTFLILLGVGFFIYAFRTKKTVTDCQFSDPKAPQD